jgi:hypothetical protein
MKIDTKIPPPARSNSAKRDWKKLPVGGSFEFDDVKPQAIVSSWAAYNIAGTYSIKHIEGNRYRFWRLK